MNTGKAFAARFVLAVLAMAASRAHAQVVDYTYMGTVAGGTDTLGVFGPSGASLAGDAYTASFEFDLSQGCAQNTAALLKQSYDSTCANPSPLVSSSLAINGTSIQVGGTSFNYVYSTNSGAIDAVAATATLFLSDGITSTHLPFSLTTPVAYTTQSGDSGQGEFNDGSEVVGLTPGSLTISLAAGTRGTGGSGGSGSTVPEPATLGLLGIGLACARLGRRRGLG